MALEVEGVVKAFGATRAVDGVDLSVRNGEFFTLLGPSGCGKTTLLRTIAGIYPLSEGRVTLDGRDITHAPMHARNLGMVFQSYALFPHLDAFENIAFGLRSRGVARAEIRARVTEALALVRMEALARRAPSELSGGQQQRVALARALVVRPDLLLLDEPLSNLDARLRREMRTEIRDLQHRLGITTVLVTHDIDEAFGMSDRIAVMRDGRIMQVGTAAEIYREPANRFVARFVGVTNELPLDDLSADGVDPRGRAAGLAVRLPSGLKDKAPGARLVLRPEHAVVSATRPALDNVFEGKLVDIAFLGGSSECRVQVGDVTLLSVMESSALAGLRPGQSVFVGWARDQAVVVRGD